MTLRTLLDRFDLLMDTPESVPKLRRFILQLAVQGRLTEQAQNDEPADQLLKCIQKKKKLLYDKGEIRKPKTIDEVKGQASWRSLPDKWTLVGLGEIIEASRNGFSKRSSESGKKTVVLRLSDISQNEVVFDDLRKIRMTESEADKYRLSEGDILAIRVNGSSSLVAQPVVIRHNDGHCFCDHFIRLSPCRDLTDSEYISLAMRSRQFRSLVENEFVTTAGQKTISQTRLLSLAVPLPPLKEQQRIVKTVDRLMDECDALEQQQERERTLQVQVGTAATEALQSADDAEALRPAWERVREHFDTVTATPEGVDALRQTILQLAVQGRLTEHDPDDTPADMFLERIQQEKQRLYDAGEIRKPKSHPAITDEDEPFDIPEKWTWTRLSNVCILENGDRGKNYPSQSDLVESGIRFINAGHLQDGTVSHDEMDYITEERFDLLGRGKVQAGDLLFCLRGSLGKCALIRNDDRGAIASSLVIVRPLRELMSRYVLTFFGSALCDALIDHYDNGTAQPNLGSTSLAEFAFPLPPPEEQKRIVEKTNRILPLCDELDSYLSKSRDRGEQLLKAALRDGSLNTSADEESIAKPV